MAQWFKFYGSEYLNDPKVMSLTACERSCWITLLSYASTAEIPGEIKYLNEYKLMVMAGIDPVDNEWETTQGVLNKLQTLNMIKQDSNGMITVINFRKRQDTALTNYERVKKFREKKRNDNERNEDDNTRVEKKRKEYPPNPQGGTFKKIDYRESPKLEMAKDIVKRLSK